MKNYAITGSLIEAYIFCPRQAWLLSRQISGNQDNDFLAIGRLISEHAYSREKKEIAIEGGKIDLIKDNDGELLVVEVKKSGKFLQSSKMQLLFYLFQLEKAGHKVKGELKIPKTKKTISVELTDNAKEELENILDNLSKCIAQEIPPKPEFSSKCRRCSYLEFCWS